MASVRSEFERVMKRAKELYADTQYRQSAFLRKCLDKGYATYANEYLKTTPTPDQLDIARLVETAPYRVLVPSANNQGKTWFMASYARYFYEKYNPSITLITATTGVQVRDAVFRELRTSQPLLPGFKPKATRVETSPNHFIHGFTAINPDAFQGRHELNMCFLFDEATGVHIDFKDRAKTMFGGHEGHAWICCYNPNDPSTWPYAEEENGNWHVVRLSALTHPNIIAELQGLPPIIPSAIRLSTVLDRLAAECELVQERLTEQEQQLCFEFPVGTGYFWRPKTQAFEAQVLGRWPLLPTESILSPSQVNKCLESMYQVSEEYELIISCDVARFGSDRTAIVVRRGPCVLHVETWQKRDSVFIIDRLKQCAYKYAVDDDERYHCKIVVDDTGGYGGAIVDNMSEYNVIPLHMASKSPNPLRTVNMRSHLWFTLAECIIAGAVDLTRLDEITLAQLRRELISPRYRIDEMGRRKLEPKIHIKERLACSPDIADALAMSFFNAV